MVQIQGVKFFDLGKLSICNDYLVSDILGLRVKFSEGDSLGPG